MSNYKILDDYIIGTKDILLSGEILYSNARGTVRTLAFFLPSSQFRAYFNDLPFQHISPHIFSHHRALASVFPPSINSASVSRFRTLASVFYPIAASVSRSSMRPVSMFFPSMRVLYPLKNSQTLSLNLANFVSEPGVGKSIYF